MKWKFQLLHLKELKQPWIQVISTGNVPGHFIQSVSSSLYIFCALSVASVLYWFFSQKRVMDLCNFLIKWAQRILHESSAFLLGWNLLDNCQRFEYIRNRAKLSIKINNICDIIKCRRDEKSYGQKLINYLSDSPGAVTNFEVLLLTFSRFWSLCFLSIWTSWIRIR